MSAPAFTPGPWKVGDTYTAGWPVKAGGHIVALAQYLGGTDPAHCNANLIAAAPDLYEALAAMATMHPDWANRLGYTEALEAANAALAKANGLTMEQVNDGGKA